MACSPSKATKTLYPYFRQGGFFHHHSREIDVVLLDIGLPKKAGLDVILKMKEEKPRVSVVVSSGYIDPESRARMYQAPQRSPKTGQ